MDIEISNKGMIDDYIKARYSIAVNTLGNNTLCRLYNDNWVV